MTVISGQLAENLEEVGVDVPYPGIGGGRHAIFGHFIQGSSA